MSLFALVFRSNRSCCIANSSRRFFGSYHLQTKTNKTINNQKASVRSFCVSSLSATPNVAREFESGINNRKMGSSSTPSPDKRVLSIQSHVVHGYVGNKSATFPLQVNTTITKLNQLKWVLINNLNIIIL